MKSLYPSPLQTFKTFFRTAIAVFATVFLCLSCSSDSDTSSERTIRFWHFFSEPSQKAALKELVAKYEAQYGIKVELTELSWGDGKAKLQAAFSSNTAPDVLELGSDWVAQFSSAGVLKDLPYDPIVKGKFVDYSVAPGRWKGAVYAYPWTLDTRVLYVNNGLLQQAGVKDKVGSIQDMLYVAQKIQGKGAQGFGANGADAHRLYKKILPFMWTLGGDVLDTDGNPVLNSSQNVEAFTLYANLARAGVIETQRQLDAAFVQNNIGLWISGSWLMKKIRDAKDLNVTPILMPGIGGAPGISFAGGEYLAVSKNSKEAQRARELVEFLTDGKNSVVFCQKVNEAGFPADKQFYNDSSLTRDTFKRVFAEQLQYARMTPVHPKWLDIEAILEDALVKVLYGDATPQQALDVAQAEVLSITNDSKK